MPKHVRLGIGLFLAVLVGFPRLASSQVRLESQSFKLGVRSEYFSRMLGVGDGSGSPQLATYLVNLSLSYELRAGFSAAVLLGYASASYKKLVFRQLPFSIDFEGGGIGGLLAGAEVGKTLFSHGGFEVDAHGQFLASIGIQKEYKIPNLAVPGSVEANPSWMRVVAGPMFKLIGQRNFTPYFTPCFHYLWGTFSMNQTVDSLKGDEKKAIKSKEQFGLLLGATLGIGRGLELRTEAGLYPRQKGLDFSVMAEAVFGF